MQEMYCFLEIFTQLATILHDCRPASTIAFNWFCLWRWQYFFSPCKGTSAHRASSGRCRWHSDKVRHLPRPLGIGVKWHYIPTLQFVYHSQAKFMTGFSCWLLPSFVPPKGLKLDHRRSWSSILLSRRRGRGTWCTTLTGRCIFELQNQIRAKKNVTTLVHPHAHISSYGIKTSPRTSPTRPSSRNMLHIPQQILFFDARSEPFLSENLRWTNTKELTSVSWSPCCFVNILQEIYTKQFT